MRAEIIDRIEMVTQKKVKFGLHVVLHNNEPKLHIRYISLNKFEKKSEIYILEFKKYSNIYI